MQALLNTVLSEATRVALKEADAKLERLRSIKPYFIDLSLRENVFGALRGQTLADKLEILPKLRAFGFTNILFGTLDYGMSDEPEVDDDFMAYLRDQGIDRTGGFAFTEVGRLQADGDFVPSASQRKMADYGVPNTLHEIYLSRIGREGLYDLETLWRSLPPSIQWIHDHVTGDHGAAPRILINIVDGCDAFAEDPQTVLAFLEMLAALPIEGISIEDDRGTFFPFQVGAYIAAARSVLPLPLKLLIHVHSGAGFENASVIEALLNGADGAWGGLPKRAAIIGHASLGELIANLVRAGNPQMEQYATHQLHPLATALQELDSVGPVPEDIPVFGTNAYRMTLDFFRQRDDRFMDLPAERIGATDGWRVCAIAANEDVLLGRLIEVTGRDASDFPKAVRTRMVKVMRRELRAGLRIDYDEPAALLALFDRSVAPLPPAPPVGVPL